MSFYTQFATHYEAIFPFSRTVYGFLRRHFPSPPAAVLDIGCGTGHYVGRLARDGYQAVGIDLNAAMVDYARTHHPTAEFHVMNMLDIVGLDQTFGAAGCIGNTAAHLTQSQFTTFLDRLRTILMPGAVWVLQVMNWDCILKEERILFPVLEGEGNVAFYREYCEISPAQITFATRLEVDGTTLFRDTTPLYPLRSDEIVALHTARGFAEVEHDAGYDGVPYNPEAFSPNLFVFRLEA